MFVVCGEALMDVFSTGATPTGVGMDARIGGSPFNVAVGLARLAQPAVRVAAPQQRAAINSRSTRIHSLAPASPPAGTRFASGTRQSLSSSSG